MAHSSVKRRRATNHQVNTNSLVAALLVSSPRRLSAPTPQFPVAMADLPPGIQTFMSPKPVLVSHWREEARPGSQTIPQGGNEAERVSLSGDSKSQRVKFHSLFLRFLRLPILAFSGSVVLSYRTGICTPSTVGLLGTVCVRGRGTNEVQRGLWRRRS